MNRAFKLLFFSIGFFIFQFTLFSQDAIIRNGVNRVGLKDADQLLKLIERDDITTTVKIRAVQRIATLYRENREEAEPQAQKFITSMTNALKNLKKDENPTFHFKVRESVCMALSDFDNSDHAASAIASIQEALLNDPNARVVQSCAQSLGEFRNNRSKAADALIARIEKNLAQKEIKYGDTGIMTVTISSLEKLRQKKAFIPLMRVIQSGYGVNVKNAADSAIESFDME